MMAAKLLRHQRESEQSWFFRKSEKVFDDVIAFYGRTLQVVLRFRTITLLVTVATLVGTILLISMCPKVSSRCRIPVSSLGFRKRHKIFRSRPWPPASRLLLTPSFAIPPSKAFLLLLALMEHHAKQRARSDQSKASRAAKNQRL